MANGIDFIIGGKDKAGPAMDSVEKSLQRLEQKTNMLASSTAALTKLTAGLAVAYGAIKSAMAMIGGISAANAAYDEQAESIKGIETALRLQGEAIEPASSKLQQFADDVQAATGETDAHILAMMKQASLLGVGTSELEDMTKAGLGLAEVMGVDGASGMNMMRMATEGNFAAFGRMIPSIKAMATDEEKLAAVLELAAKGFESKATWANKTAETSAAASVSIDKLSEAVGAIVAPFRTLWNKGVSVLVNALSTALIPAVEYAESVLADIGPTLEWLERTITTMLGPAVRNISWLLEGLGPILSWLGEHVKSAIDAMVEKFLWFQVVVTNLGSVWELITAHIELYLRQIVEAHKHVLVDVIPRYVMWFGENIVNLFKDAFNIVLSVFMNSSRMMGEILIELFKFVFQDMGEGSAALGERIGNILASGITRGFESSLTSLPEIAGRQITDREKELSDKIGKIGANLGDQFNDKMNAHLAGAGGIGGDINTQIDLALNKAKAKEDEENKSKRKDGTFGASINAMESRLLTRGPASTYEQRMLGATEKIGQILLRTGEWVKATKDEIEEMNKQDPKKVRFVPVQ
jgi:hypothetical protein